MCALLDSYVPDKINYYSLNAGDVQKNAEHACNVMKEIGIPVYVMPEDLIRSGGKVDEKTLLTQLAAAKIVLENLKARDAERLAKERVEAERLAKEKDEAERLAKEKAEAERLAREKAEAEKLAREKAEEERLAKEKAEAEAKAAAERLAREKAEAAAKAEADRLSQRTC